MTAHAPSPLGAAGDAATGSLARAPIYDRGLVVRAYELVADADGVDTLARALAPVGLDGVVGARLAVVTATDRLLADLPSPVLPAERVVVAAGTASGEELARVHACGYDLAVDETAPPELLDLARLVRVDVSQHDEAALESLLRRLLPHGVELLAHGVADYDCFERCKQSGFDLFAGPFLQTPRAGGEEVPAGRLSKLQLMAALQQPDVEFEQLERIIERDVGLSYRLLRAVNSGFFYLPNRISSIRDALVRLGQRAIREWSTLVVARRR